MYNYSALNHNMKSVILKFSEKISKYLTRSKFKFVAQMIFWNTRQPKLMHSEIGRKLSEKTTLKKTIERLSRNLKEFNQSNFLKTTLIR